MNNRGTKYRIFIASWTLAALMLCIGSLVHFHQWKIYGKPLQSEMVVTKREQHDFVKAHPADEKYITGSAAVLCGPVTIPLCSAVRTAITCPGLVCPVFHIPANAGLRAPPLA